MSERLVVPVFVLGWLLAQRGLPTAFAIWKEQVKASSADLPSLLIAA